MGIAYSGATYPRGTGCSGAKCPRTTYSGVNGPGDTLLRGQFLRHRTNCGTTNGSAAHRSSRIEGRRGPAYSFIFFFLQVQRTLLKFFPPLLSKLMSPLPTAPIHAGMAPIHAGMAPIHAGMAPIHAGMASLHKQPF